MEANTAYQMREPRIHTLQSYINDEPIDYVQQNGTDINELQNINNLKNASDTLQTGQSQALTNIPDDFDLDQFLKGSIAEINAQVVGADNKSFKKISQNSYDSTDKVYTQIKQQNCNVNNYLYGQQTGKPKVQTLDDILKQSISKMDYISEQCQQTIQYSPTTINDNVDRHDAQTTLRTKQVDFKIEPNVITFQKQNNQNQDPILQNVNFDFDIPKYNNLFDERMMNQNEQVYNNEDIDQDEQGNYTQYAQYTTNQNPRQCAINKTIQQNDSFQYIAHRLPSMRTETRESKVLKSQLQNKALQEEIATIRQIQCEQSATIAMQRKQIQSELKKYQKWMLQTFDIDIDKIFNQRSDQAVKTTLFNPSEQQLQTQQKTNVSNQRQPNKNISNKSQESKVLPSQVRNHILQASRSNSRQNMQFSQVKSQYSQLNLAKNSIKPKNNIQMKQKRQTNQNNSQSNSRVSSRASSTSRSASQVQKSLVRSTVLNTPQSIKAGMRNNILSKQMQVVEPKVDGAVYYRQMLQRRLYEQKLEEQRRIKAVEAEKQENGEKFTFQPQINQRPAYLDQMQRLQKSNQKSFYDEQDDYIKNPPYLQNGSKTAQEYTIEQYEQDEKYLEEQIKTLNSQLQQSQLHSFRGRSVNGEQNIQYVNKNAFQNQQSYQQQQEYIRQQQYQNSYKPTINKIQNDQITDNLKKYLDTPVYDRLQNKSFNSRSNTPQQEPEQKAKKMNTTDFKKFLARQTASQQKKMKNILLKQAETESDVITKANMSKMSRQSELYLKYRNMLGNSQKNSSSFQPYQRNPQPQKGPTGYNQYKNKVLNNIYDVQIGEQRQFNGQIW